MENTIYKVLENCEVKKVGERQYEFTASTADMDRDGEVIDVSGWDLKNFKKNPVIMFAHDYRTLPIGKATKIGVKDGKLMDVVEFPPEGTYEFADTVARLVDAGYLKTQSVGFIPKKWEDGDMEDDDSRGKKPRRTYTKQELLEISIVPVPSNPNALMNAVKDGVITTKQFESLTEGEPEVEMFTDDGILDGRTNIRTTPITKPEETDEFIRIPVRECQVTATIDISKKEGISALYCGKEKQVRTYLFRKDKGWTMAKAKEWVKEHEGKSAHEISQEEIIDELDYLDSLLKENGANDKVKEILQRVAQSYLDAIQDATIPVDIKEDTTKESLTLLSEIIKEQMEVI